MLNILSCVYICMHVLHVSYIINNGEKKKTNVLLFLPHIVFMALPILYLF